MSNTIRAKPFWFANAASRYVNLNYFGERKMALIGKGADGRKFICTSTHDAFRGDKFRGYAEIWGASGKKYSKRARSRHVRNWAKKVCNFELKNMIE